MGNSVISEEIEAITGLLFMLLLLFVVVVVVVVVAVAVCLQFQFRSIKTSNFLEVISYAAYVDRKALFDQ